MKYQIVADKEITSVMNTLPHQPLVTPMTTNRVTEIRTAPRTPEPAKRPFALPTLTKHGTVATLTQDYGGSGFAPD